MYLGYEEIVRERDITKENLEMWKAQFEENKLTEQEYIDRLQEFEWVTTMYRRMSEGHKNGNVSTQEYIEWLEEAYVGEINEAVFSPYHLPEVYRDALFPQLMAREFEEF